MENRPWSVRQAVSPQGKNQEALWKLTRPSGKLGWVRDPAQVVPAPEYLFFFSHTWMLFFFLHCLKSEPFQDDLGYWADYFKNEHSQEA